HRGRSPTPTVASPSTPSCGYSLRLDLGQLTPAQRLGHPAPRLDGQRQWRAVGLCPTHYFRPERPSHEHAEARRDLRCRNISELAGDEEVERVHVLCPRLRLLRRHEFPSQIRY